MSNQAQPELQPVAIHEQTPSGLEVVSYGTMGPGDHPIGSMEAAADTDTNPDPLAYTAREQEIVDRWDREKADILPHPDSPDSTLPADHPDVQALQKQYDMEATDSGLIAPSAATDETKTPGQQTGEEDNPAGFMSSLSNFLRKHKGLTIGMGAVGGAIGMNAVDAAVAPSKADARFEWRTLGGDPFVKGGLKSEEHLERILKSSRGRKALREQGLNRREIRKVIAAASNEPGRGNNTRDVRNCRLKRGDKFDTMAFGQTGVIANDVVYKGKAAPAKCIDVKMPNGKKIEVKVPIKCANAAIESKIGKPPKKPPKKRPPTGRLDLVKAFEDANGNPLAISGQEFKATCVVRGLGKRVASRFEYNPNRRRGPVTALRGCKVGTVATMMEITPPGHSNHWNVLTGKPVVKNGRTVGFAQKQRVNRGRNLFGFKNVQKRPNIPPPFIPPKQPPQEQPAFFPPSISIASWDHIKTGDVQEICSFESDPDNDIVSTSFTENGNGFFTTDPNNPYPGGEPGEKCVKYAAGSLAQEGATITSTVRDARNQSASATEVFDIDDGSRGEF